MSGALDSLREVHVNIQANLWARVSAAKAILDASLKYTERPPSDFPIMGEMACCSIGRT